MGQDDLRKTLAKTQLKKHTRDDEDESPLHRMDWAAAARHYADPNREVAKMPVIVDANSLIKSPEDVKKICNLDTVPKLEHTTRTEKYSPAKWTPADDDGEKVDFCEVTIYQQSDLRYATVGEYVKVWFRGEPRKGWRVTAVREQPDDGVS